MIRAVEGRALLALVLLTPLAAGGSCEIQTCPPADPPMTPARAKEIDPTIDTGLAVSTTHVFGDCRAMDSAPSTGRCGGSDGRCAREREPLRVQIVPVNVSVPIAPACAPAFDVDDLSQVAVFDGDASDRGELVIRLDPGRYTLYVSADDRCAVCALTDEGGACSVAITRDSVLVRELVLDQSSH